MARRIDGLEGRRKERWSGLCCLEKEIKEEKRRKREWTGENLTRPIFWAREKLKGSRASAFVRANGSEMEQEKSPGKTKSGERKGGKEKVKYISFQPWSGKEERT